MACLCTRGACRAEAVGVPHLRRSKGPSPPGMPDSALTQRTSQLDHPVAHQATLFARLSHATLHVPLQ